MLAVICHIEESNGWPSLDDLLLSSTTAKDGKRGVINTLSNDCQIANRSTMIVKQTVTSISGFLFIIYVQYWYAVGYC